MKSSRKNTWLLILMIVSQIMLAGFLMEWIRSQWFEEKASLRKDFDQKFMESVNQVIDSMLVKHMIVQVINDSSSKKDQLIEFNKKVISGKGPSHHMAAFFNDSSGRSQTMVTITLPDSIKGERKENVTYRSYDSTEKTMLIRSIKLIIKQSGDPTGTGNRFSYVVSQSPDTALLRNLFDKKLESSGSPLNAIWNAETGKINSDHGSPNMYFKTNVFEKPLSMAILNYRGLIFKRILPQVLFAIILLLSTVTAFFFTYRNLKKQETLNTLRNDFISNISHELKTPVSTVSIALEALKNFDIKNNAIKSDEYLSIAIVEMNRLDQLISQILNTSVLETNDEYLKPEDTDLVSLTRDVLSSMQVRLQQSDARVSFTYNNEEIILKLDKLHIQGVLVNLLDNSLKYSSGQPEIKIGIEKKNSQVLLTISDNGQGIPEEYISKVFDKFFRVPKGNTHNIKGYGLGLSFAQLVMKAHSGSIGVRNLSGGGCEFSLTFNSRES